MNCLHLINPGSIGVSLKEAELKHMEIKAPFPLFQQNIISIDGG